MGIWIRKLIHVGNRIGPLRQFVKEIALSYFKNLFPSLCYLLSPHLCLFSLKNSLFLFYNFLCNIKDFLNTHARHLYYQNTSNYCYILLEIFIFMALHIYIIHLRQFWAQSPSITVTNLVKNSISSYYIVFLLLLMKLNIVYQVFIDIPFLLLRSYQGPDNVLDI